MGLANQGQHLGHGAQQEIGDLDKGLGLLPQGTVAKAPDLRLNPVRMTETQIDQGIAPLLVGDKPQEGAQQPAQALGKGKGQAGEPKGQLANQPLLPGRGRPPTSRGGSVARAL